jgi:hypothetical protein
MPIFVFLAVVRSSAQLLQRAVLAPHVDTARSDKLKSSRSIR